MFNFKKKSYRFELTQTKNITVDAIKNAPDLVNFIIGENQSLLERGEAGSLVVSKIEVSKKGEQILFAQHLTLPMKAKTNFDALLEPFYTKSPIDFDEKILEEHDENSALLENKRKETYEPKMESTFQRVPQVQSEENEDEYAPAPQLDLSDDDEIELNAELDPLDATEDKSEPSISSSPESNVPTSDALTEEIVKKIVAEQMREKDQEIERLKKVINDKPELEIAEVDNSTTSKEENAPEVILEAPAVSYDFSEDANVLEMIQMVKNEANKRLDEFIAQETAKINADIEALDTRNKIEANLTTRFGDEKAVKVEALNRKIDLEKTEAIAAENARHETALNTIETEHEASRTTQLTELSEEFAHQLSSAIKDEYERQTEQLNLILQGKTEELQLRQKAVNEGMKVTLTEVLEGFNANHGEVIQNVERRKNSSSLISLHKRVG